ncbi:hypothetical protein T265_07245 [Opisthorchis viverrini]|uniref:Uncharacterized protein n=1 Tax=Opisthorchis viverrini TaxID=6198 RepID=A0A075AC42_OPIVI|nr:hypothetical protein T265_07245 [Opisthorchis viverrini]KER25259.1 hypothetical protein T265_07245 [Opisthorchis viverrini]
MGKGLYASLLQSLIGKSLLMHSVTNLEFWLSMIQLRLKPSQSCGIYSGSQLAYTLFGSISHMPTSFHLQSDGRSEFVDTVKLALTNSESGRMGVDVLDILQECSATSQFTIS